MNYKDYSKWKGWINENSFGHISVDEYEKYKAQLSSLSIKYEKVNAFELGYGNGAFLAFLVKNETNVEGVEIQQCLIDAANKFGIPAYESMSFLRNYPYDLIVAFDVLEHMTILQIQNIFEIFSKMLKHDGSIILRFPNSDSFAGLSAQNGDYTHITSIGQQKLSQLLAPYDLRIDRFEGELVYPRNLILGGVRMFFRWLFMKLLGVGNPYFFSTNVIVVLKKNY